MLVNVDSIWLHGLEACALAVLAATSGAAPIKTSALATRLKPSDLSEAAMWCLL
jgi:hypothetical protein